MKRTGSGDDVVDGPPGRAKAGVRREAGGGASVVAGVGMMVPSAWVDVGVRGEC